MSYIFATTLALPFDAAVTKTIEALQKEGFGVLTEIDVKETLKKKIDVDFRPYRILGACNPTMAYRALQSEPDIGAMLPCNVVVQEASDGVRVSAIDPVASMQAVTNPDLGEIAGEVRDALRRVIQTLSARD
ncbi:MAG: hypothetical protein VR70_14550 [Rhodospirillaceae bacterium BRH_c57]|nr:MAG: hypothetical protein VR70_14550 [Rhodospirillaceae bacterium BRH_c57]